MRKAFITVILILTFLFSQSQDRWITGKVITEDLEGYTAHLSTMDEKKLTVTDMNGEFRFLLPNGINKIKVSALACGVEVIEIKPSCDNIEVILLEMGTYDFIPLKRAKRKWKRHKRRMLPKLYEEAYKNNIFQNQVNCRFKISK